MRKPLTVGWQVIYKRSKLLTSISLKLALEVDRVRTAELRVHQHICHELYPFEWSVKCFASLQRAFSLTPCGCNVCLYPLVWDSCCAVIDVSAHLYWSISYCRSCNIPVIVNTSFPVFPPKMHHQHLDVLSVGACQSSWHFKKIYNLHPVCQCAISHLIVREASVIETQVQ